MDKDTRLSLASLLDSKPDAAAQIKGSREHPQISGTVRFYQTPAGVIVYALISGLPRAEKPCKNRIFAFHIHSGRSCTGNGDDPFADVGGHYDPKDCPHPNHSGDMPPLFGSREYALSVFLTDRFTVREVLGRTVIIHDKPDDFTTQPSGNAGRKIACGVIRKM